MIVTRKILIKSITIAALVIGLGLGARTVVHAQPDLGLNFAETIGLSDQDPRLTVAKVIRVGLSLLGIIAICIILYAGWIWMTASGNEEKIDKAKKILKAGLIGLVIILASFGIASFIISKLVDVTGGGGGGGGVCIPSCEEGMYCCGGTCQAEACSLGGVSSFLVSGTAPRNSALNLPRNTVIRYKFNENVKESSVTEESFNVYEEPAHTVVAGTRIVSGRYIEFKPTATCPPPHEDLHCFSATTQLSVAAQEGEIEGLSGRKLLCLTSNPCAISFETGNYIDTESPRVNITTRQVCAIMDNPFNASSTDDYGVSKIDFYVADTLAGSEINTGPLTPFNASIIWDGTRFEVGTNVVLKATAYDFDSHDTSAQKNVRISANHCCNGIQDIDERGEDCGGSCLACDGQACAADINAPLTCSDEMCSSDFCTATGSTTSTCSDAGFGSDVTSCCLCQAKPQINAISPVGGFCSTDVNKRCTIDTEATDCGAINTCDLVTPNGDSGNFLTLQGTGFGSRPGKVFFTGSRLPAPLANDPLLGNAACGTSVWTNNQITVVVPTDAINGPIRVESSAEASDSTDDGHGPLINNFKKNTIERPGICTITPDFGKINDTIEYAGIKLNASEAYFGSEKALSSTFSRPKDGSAVVPNLVTGNTTTYVLKSNVYSNFISFRKDAEPFTGPVISSIEPLTGPVGQYITIRGSGFGNSRGTSRVVFGDISGPEADYKFPEVCAQSIWKDKEIIIKVPVGISLGRYKLTIARDGFDPIDSGVQQFEVVSGEPNPGLCRVEPSLGQPNSAVTFWGEYFKTFNPTNSVVRFYNNKEQRGDAITFWDIDSTARGIKPWKVVTTAHDNSSSGPVRVETNGQVSNSLNFGVGVCTRDEDCGGFEVCCAAGLPEAGRCKADATQCYGNVATSVYEWQFSTGYQSSTCSPDQEQCGTACCAIGYCENPDISKCSQCAPDQNQCGDGTCCSGACVSGGTGRPSTCAASCSGYNNNQCIEGYFCPNSPGKCSPSLGTGSIIVTGQCGNDFCNTKEGCEDNSCEYNTSLNRCVKTAAAAESCSAKDLKDRNGIRITINNRPVEGTCVISNRESWWQINWATSCPDGWTRGVGNKCLDTSRVNGECSICGNGQTCVGNGDRGVCAVGNAVCTNGATCNVGTGDCEKTDSGTCDCCCRIDNAAQDCCAGLTCGGSCGSGPGLGVCSGCVVGGVPDDSLCNCVGTTGKFCDASLNPRGECKDCASITDPNVCSSHDECCLDAKNGNKCTSLRSDQERIPEIVGTETLQYCGYYSCTGLSPNSCNLAPVKNGIYNTLDSCQRSCVSAPVPCSMEDMCANPHCGPGSRCKMDTCECVTDNVGDPEDPCAIPGSLACMLTGCAAGYNCINRRGDTCRCCCKPPVNPGDIDSCKDINPNLSCLANQGDCSGGDRGLCCGCSKDADCGDVANTGCGTTGGRCCSARPTVTSVLPEAGATNVCRNAAVEAIFSKRMDIASFSKATNVEIIGDYGTDPCPSGYPIVAMGAPSNRLVKWLTPLRRVMVKIAPFLLTKSAFADMSHFCVVSGSPIGNDIDSVTTKLNYRLTRPLEANIKYYVVLKGDPALPDFITMPQDYYNGYITSLTNVGMIGRVVLGRDVPAIFNHTEFKNAEIWPFTTGDEICTLDTVNVSPNFHLFQTTGEKKILTSNARTRNGQTIQAIPMVYDWNWEWSSDNNEVATVTQQSILNFAEATAGNKKDAQTLGKAAATITADTVSASPTTGRVVKGSARLRLFLCENPWPIYLTIPGYVWPWKDDVTGIEFYYCRDKNGIGTSDDLPALKEDPLTRESGRRICMSGNNVGQICTSDANCGNVRSSCWPEVLKEFFFFRENITNTPIIRGEVPTVGGKVILTWPTVAGATKYKIYYGLSPRQYTFNTEVVVRLGITEVVKTIEPLANGVDYYFAVTALTDKNQETEFSNELNLKPEDSTAPAKPNILGSGADGRISLFWEPVPQAVSYIAYLGVEPRGGEDYVYPTNKTTRTIPAPNQPNVIFNGLDNSGTYYLAVKAVDQYGNISPYSSEITVKPNSPYLISVEAGLRPNSVVLKWLPFIGAQGYTISYISTTVLTPTFVDVGSTTFSRTISGLTSDTNYTFKIIAKKGNGQNSLPSNQRNFIAR